MELLSQAVDEPVQNQTVFAKPTEDNTVRVYTVTKLLAATPLPLV